MFKITKLIAENKKLKQEKEELEKLLESELDGSIEIDFSKINAFSIERTINDCRICTSIGYLLKDNSIEEWVFYCSIEKHEELVKKFKKYIEDSE